MISGLSPSGSPSDEPDITRERRGPGDVVDQARRAQRSVVVPLVLWSVKTPEEVVPVPVEVEVAVPAR
jgi:hypothetical protein